MNTLAFMTANYVARQLDYHMTQGWMEGDDATNAYFRPLATYAERFESDDPGDRRSRLHGGRHLVGSPALVLGNR